MTKSSVNNLVHTDDSIKSMHEFITECGDEPVKPDACSGEAYTNNKFGDLAEQYITCLLKETGITKLVARETPSPDFEVLINGERFLLEVKAVSNLYKNLFHLLWETVEEENNDTFLEKAKILFDNCNFYLTPAEIHRGDEREFKEELKGIIKEIQLPLHNKTDFQIKCKLKMYALSISPAKHRIEGAHSLVVGWLPNETKTLGNIISENKRQVGSSDILVVILLNKTIGQDDLLDFFYRPVENVLSLQAKQEISQNVSIRTMTQYQYEQAIWGREFEDEQGQLHTIDERLKSVIVIYPSSKTCLIFPSIKHFGNFSAPEYFYLRKFLEGKRFKCCWASHEVKLVR